MPHNNQGFVGINAIGPAYGFVVFFDLLISYLECGTTYLQAYILSVLPPKTHIEYHEPQVWFRNYYYLQELELEMRSFLNAFDFNSFKFNAEYFKDKFEMLKTALPEA